ncbi:hypothetical protein ACN47E_006742 [Coniothyrium glycines]
MEGEASDEKQRGAYSAAKASRFHFKSGSKRGSKRDRSADGESKDSDRRRQRSRSPHDEDLSRDYRKSRRSHKRTHRRTRDDRHTTSTKDGTYYDPESRHRESLYDNLYDAEAHTAEVAPDEAFRESLFDALADDEGAAYWEGVYGQPVHVYPDTKRGPDGKLERMSEEEYADYVRTKMWEKSHQHIVEEREAKAKARQKQKEQRRPLDEDVEREEAERESIRRQMAESLRRGEDRKRAKQAEAAWENYVKKWNHLKTAQDLAATAGSKACELIPWPVMSGNISHAAKDDIEHFFKSSAAWKDDPAALLKLERVRWHPDKMQQRFGQHIDIATMKSVTAVFQVIDRMWNAQR